LKAVDTDGSIHACIFSNRADGLIGTLKSMEINARHPEDVHVWIVTNNMTSVEVAASHTEKIHVHGLELQEVEQDLIRKGMTPVWKWPEYNSTVIYEGGAHFNRSWGNENTAYPDSWDNNTMHMDPLNHLRFYIPHMAQFEDLKQILFMDDDLIVQGDVREAWDTKDSIPKGKVLVNACEIWAWSKKLGTMAYVGRNKRLGDTYSLAQQRSSREALLCKNHRNPKTTCVGSNFYSNLEKRFQEINGFPYEPETYQAWNYGFTLFDLQAWREERLTPKYVAWMRAIYDDHIFPENSLRYGLGVPFLLLAKKIACWHDTTGGKINVRDGFGLLTTRAMVKSGFDGNFIADSFVVHYNGRGKPWINGGKGINPTFMIPYTNTLEGRAYSHYESRLRSAKFTSPPNHQVALAKKISADQTFTTREDSPHLRKVHVVTAGANLGKQMDEFFAYYKNIAQVDTIQFFHNLELEKSNPLFSKHICERWNVEYDTYNGTFMQECDRPGFSGQYQCDVLRRGVNKLVARTEDLKNTWVLFVDIDEFVDTRTKTLPQYLFEMGLRGHSGVRFRQILYGTQYIKNMNRDLVTETHTRGLDVTHWTAPRLSKAIKTAWPTTNRYQKSAYRLDVAVKCGDWVHYCLKPQAQTYTENAKVARVHHYMIQDEASLAMPFWGKKQGIPEQMFRKLLNYDINREKHWDYVVDSKDDALWQSKVQHLKQTIYAMRNSVPTH